MSEDKLLNTERWLGAIVGMRYRFMSHHHAVRENRFSCPSSKPVLSRVCAEIALPMGDAHPNLLC